MATHRVSMMQWNLKSDSSGLCFPSDFRTELTMANPKDQLCMVMQEPAGGGDIGFSGSFDVPENYSSSELAVFRYVLDGAPGTTEVNLGIRFLNLINDESIDQAYGTEIVVTETPGEADEDMVVETIDISAHTFVKGDESFWNFFINDSVADPYLGNILAVNLYLQYSD